MAEGMAGKEISFCSISGVEASDSETMMITEVRSSDSGDPVIVGKEHCIHFYSFLQVFMIEDEGKAVDVVAVTKVDGRPADEFFAELMS